ncbi:MAG: DUF3426 domain-containing protein [Methylophilus sp.]|uniref:DUF3426 domain-containing protein n=1 Tax=Methylophilus sp. TaxID=29541 RepID=UPI003FA12B67
MSLITECPACFTQFEVNDEQLQAYAGKVRCGECNHVFDAQSALVTEAEIAEPAETTPQVIEPSTIEAETSEVDISEAATLAENAPEIQTAPLATLDSPTEVLEPSPTPQYAEPEELEQAPALSWNLGYEEAHDPAIPAFLRNVSLTDDRPPAPEKTTLPWIFPLLSGLLLIAILLQLVYFTRTSLAANYPSTKPLLQSACKVLHCAVALPNDITQLTIDDADIQEHREREGVLVFSSVLINHGAVAQAYPMIELTLTNMADEPVLRKILKPAEYLPTAAKATEGLAAQQEQAVKTTLGIAEKAVTGFRVAIAY